MRDLLRDQWVWLLLMCYLSYMLGIVTGALMPNKRREEMDRGMLRMAYIEGMDKCREVKERFGQWPSTLGRTEYAASAYPDDPMEEPQPVDPPKLELRK